MAPWWSPASIAASIHPATLPLVRQQLDLLATEQFRWTGEAWPGAKLDPYTLAVLANFADRE